MVESVRPPTDVIDGLGRSVHDERGVECAEAECRPVEGFGGDEKLARGFVDMFDHPVVSDLVSNGAGWSLHGRVDAIGGGHRAESGSDELQRVREGQASGCEPLADAQRFADPIDGTCANRRGRCPRR